MSRNLKFISISQHGINLLAFVTKLGSDIREQVIHVLIESFLQLLSVHFTIHIFFETFFACDVGADNSSSKMLRFFVETVLRNQN